MLLVKYIESNIFTAQQLAQSQHILSLAEIIEIIKYCGDSHMTLMIYLVLLPWLA